MFLHFSPITKEVFAVTIALQIFVMAGLVPGYCAYVVSQLQNDTSSIYIANESLVLIASMSVFLRPVGTVLNIISIEKFGRRGSIQISFGLLTIGWLTIALASSATVLFAGEALIGICLGMLGSGNLYVSEISTDKYRAAFVASSGIFIAFGTTLAYILMYFFSWRIVAACITVYSMSVFISTRCIPETPYWYILRGRRKEAENSLRWSNRYGQLEMEERLDAIQNSTTEETSFKSICKSIRQPFILQRILVTLTLLLLIRAAGHLVINYYAVKLFDVLEFPLDSQTLTIVFGFLCFFSNVLAVFIIGKIGHKTLIVSSSVGSIITLIVAILSRTLITESSSPVLYAYIPHVSVVCVFVHIAFLYAGVGETIWVTIPELFPTLVRGSALVIMNFASGFITTASTYSFPAALNVSFTFLCAVFAISSILVMLIVIFFLPETANIPLHQAGIITKTKS